MTLAMQLSVYLSRNLRLRPRLTMGRALPRQMLWIWRGYGVGRFAALQSGPKACTVVFHGLAPIHTLRCINNSRTTKSSAKPIHIRSDSKGAAMVDMMPSQ